MGECCDVSQGISVASRLPLLKDCLFLQLESLPGLRVEILDSETQIILEQEHTYELHIGMVNERVLVQLPGYPLV